jgi:hypothetical protein
LGYCKKDTFFDGCTKFLLFDDKFKLGRKDEVLARMYDTKSVTSEELKQAIIE